MELKKIAPEAFSGNVFQRIGHQWALLAAGDAQASNAMTVSWGGLGVLWGKNMATVYVRPERYTDKFLKSGSKFSLCFLPEQYRDALNKMGTLSGRDGDKAAAAGLTPLLLEGVPAFAEAEAVLLCRKRYVQLLDGEQILAQPDLARFYQNSGMHQMYLGEILAAYERG